MAIIGIGTDVVAVDRMRELIEKHQERVYRKIFTEIEQSYCLRFRDPSPHFAARFAAKEATYKALGGQEPLSWLSAWIENLPSGQPILHLEDAALALANQLGARTFFVTLAHDAGVATATVVLEQ